MANLTPQDKEAVLQTARNLRMDPNELGALVLQESGFRPNVWGGGGNNYYGLIQFGGPERKEVGLDPKKIGSYTVAEQMPYVEKFLKGRGFEPGKKEKKAYATVLGGNPYASVYSEGANKTSVASAAPRMIPGGDLYKQSEQLLGASTFTGTEAFNTGLKNQPQTSSKAAAATTADGIPININISFDGTKETKERKSLADLMRNNLLMEVMQQKPLINPMTLLQQMGAMYQ